MVVTKQPLRVFAAPLPGMICLQGSTAEETFSSQKFLMEYSSRRVGSKVLLGPRFYVTFSLSVHDLVLYQRCWHTPRRFLAPSSLVLPISGKMSGLCH